MSVPKGKRKDSQFKVLTHWYEVRTMITDLLLREFSFREDKYIEKLQHKFGGSTFEDLSDEDKHRYQIEDQRARQFHAWFIPKMKDVVFESITNVGRHIFYANSIYPTCKKELQERRIHQDRAIAACFALLQELQYAMETLPVDVNKFLPVAKELNLEIELLKGWRQSNNKFLKSIEGTG